jgi:MFS family permease
MGGSTFLIGFLPTYSQAGIWAPILLVGLRLIQGLSAGGEIGGSAVYLTEHAGNQNRGLKTSVLQLMGPLGLLASTLQIIFLRSVLNTDDFLEWGWRVPFWISIVLLIIAVYIRRNLEETPVFLSLLEKGLSSKSPLLDNIRNRATLKQMLILFFCISSGGAILFFCVQVYSGIFLKATLGLPSQKVDIVMMIATVCLFPLTILSGALSDHVGRRPVVIAGLVLGTILIYPAYQFIQSLSFGTEPNYFLITSILIALSFPLALVVGPQTALLAELFPAKTRNSAATLPHNLAAGWIGGMLPLIVAWLNQEFKNTTAGLWYPTLFLACAAIIAIIYLPETKSKNLSD